MEFAEYVRVQRAGLLRFAAVLSGQAWLADDLVSDVLGKAFERWDRIGAMAQPHAYVRRMIVNEHLSWRRRLRHRASTGVEMHDTPVADGTQEHADRDAMITRLSRLPPRQRAAVVLRYYAGLSDPDIAAELGCRVSTVRSQISRALNALRIDTTITESPDHRTVEPLETR